MEAIQAKWINSEGSYNLVVEQIKERWGDDEVKARNPRLYCLTYEKWKKHGYAVRRNERAIKAYSVAKIANENGHASYSSKSFSSQASCENKENQITMPIGNRL